MQGARPESLLKEWQVVGEFREDHRSGPSPGVGVGGSCVGKSVGFPSVDPPSPYYCISLFTTGCSNLVFASSSTSSMVRDEVGLGENWTPFFRA